MLNYIFIYFSIFISVDSAMVRISKDTKNWTSCKEFLTNPTFRVQDVVNVTWTMFYYWSLENDMKIDLSFRFAKDQIVTRFKSLMEGHLIRPVDWSKAELYVWSQTDILGMLFSTRRKGVYKMVPALPVQDSRFHDVKVDPRTLALKFVDKYLMAMVCETKYAYAFARKGDIPNKDQTINLTEVFNLKSKGKSTFYITDNPFKVTEFDSDASIEKTAMEHTTSRDFYINSKY